MHLHLLLQVPAGITHISLRVRPEQEPPPQPQTGSQPEPQPQPIGARTKKPSKDPKTKEPSRKPSKKDLRLALQDIKDADAAADHKAALDLYEKSLAVLRSEVAAGQRPQNELEMFATRISEVERKIQERTAKLQRRGKARRRSAGEVSNS